MSETITLRPISVVSTSGTVSNTGRAYDNDLNTYASESRSLTISKTTQQSATSSFRLRFGTIRDALPSGAIIKTAELCVKFSDTISANPNSNYYRWSPSYYTRVVGNDSTYYKQYSSTTTAGASLHEYDITDIEPVSSGSSFDVVCAVSGSGRKTSSKYSSVTLSVSANVYEVYLVITYEMPTGVTTKVKVNGVWEEGVLKAKVNGEWVDATALYIKNGGSWIKIE